MRWRILCAHLSISVTDEQAHAMDQLEDRGMTFCGNFGYSNAVDLLAGMDKAAEDGTLYEWLRVHMGVC